jgi:hypothetical protein
MVSGEIAGVGPINQSRKSWASVGFYRLALECTEGSSNAREIGMA